MKKSDYHSLILHLAGIYVFFLSCGYYQEKIITKLYGNQKFRYYIFVSLFQSLSGALISFLALKRRKDTTKVSTWLLLDYLKCSILKLLGSQFAYRATDYLNYPTALMARSCKAIPFLIMNLLVYKRKYAIRKYVSSVLLTAGVFFFSFTSEKRMQGSERNQVAGILLISVSLLFDGYLNSSQDNIFKIHDTNSFHMMLYLNIFSAIISFVASSCSGELFKALLFICREPSVIHDLLCITFLNIMGQVFIYSMLEKHGALTLAISTISRKILSLLVSIIFFRHTLKTLQHLGLVCVFGSFAVEILFIQKKKVKGP